MADLAVEGDGYSDEDLDTLPMNALQKLQEDAFKSTQQPRTHVIDTFSKRQAQTHASAGVAGDYHVSFNPSNVDLAAPPKSPHQPSSDYGDFDDDMLDGDIFDGAGPSTAAYRARSPVPVGETTQRERWRQHRYSAPLQISANQARHICRLQNDAEPPSQTNFLSQNNVISPMKAPLAEPLAGQNTELGLADINSLQAQIQNLLSERETLQQIVTNANETSFIKAGEIAMVREKVSKLEQDFDFRTKAQQKLHADESSRYKMEIEKVQSDIRNVTTEKAFLENELAESSKQLRRIQQGAKKTVSTSAEPNELSKEISPGTPRKKKNLAYSDGFNDDEIHSLSPSKLALRHKTSTPRAGVKRKRRTVDDSPVKLQQLEFIEAGRNRNEMKAQQKTVGKPIVGNQDQRQRGAHLQFIQKLLNHRVKQSQERTIEALSQFKLPSRPHKALSTLLYDDLLMLGEGVKVKNLPAAVGLVVISLWSQCLEDRFLLPVYLLIDLIEFIIVISSFKTAPELTDSLMGLVQETADIVIIPRCQKKSTHLEKFHITSSSCLRVIQLMAQDCSIDAEEISRFWRTVRFDFTMMLLSFLHPLEDIHMAVAILRTSVLESSFAMIIPQGDGKQDVSEAHVIDNLTRLLVEAPRLTQGERHLDPVELSELRLEILGLLEAMCESQYCAEALAKHRVVIGRLVRVMNDELDKAYDYLHGHTQRIALVNGATHLLYILMSGYAPLIDLQARLSVIPGGEKKFLIALTRLAFSEGSFLEEGIKDEVVDEAHQMLEVRVSPEEADQLVSAFASAQSSRLVSREPV